MKKLLVLLLLLVVVGLPLALIGAAILAFDERPLLARGNELTPAHIERAKALAKKHDPRKAREGQLRSVQLTAAELDLLANYGAQQLRKGSAQVLLQPGVAALRVSLPTPGNPLGGWLNVDAMVRETSGLPEVESLRIGRLPVPGFIANHALRYAAGKLAETDAHAVAADTLRSVSIADGMLRVVYEWRADLPDRIKALAVSKEDAARLRAYHEMIFEVAKMLPPKGASLADLWKPVMQLAAQRSASSDALAENRAAILAVAFYANGKGLAALVPEARGWPRPVARGLLLRGRGDLTQHFTISAALAVTAGTPLSNAVGLYKEVDDSRGGSGFSFSDLAADRAGTVFGELALKSAESARRLHTRVAAGVTEADMMPEVTDLPDGLTEAEFKRRFGGVGQPAYDKLAREIERRVAACPLYR